MLIEVTKPFSPTDLPLRAVNGWRGPGAIAIALAHFWITTDFFLVGTLEPIALLVDLFFVLSGLLIAKVYMEKLRQPSAFPEYIVRRLGRIWPVQAVTLAILVAYELAKLIAEATFGLHFSVPAFAADGGNFAEAIWTNLLLVHSLGVHARETWNFPSWSLSVEFFTYAIFALFCLLGPWRRRALAVVTVTASITILVVVAPHHMRSTYDFGLFRCLAGFFAGTLCFEIVQRTTPRRWPLPTLTEVLALTAIVLWLKMGVDTYWAFAAPIFLSLFIAAFLPERGLLSRVLVLKPFQVLADLSFSIYMVHGLVLIFFLAVLHTADRIAGHPLFVLRLNSMGGSPGSSAFIDVIHLDGFVPKLLLVAAYMGGVLLAAYAVHRFVEVPGRVFFGRVANWRPQAREISAAPKRSEGRMESTS